MFKKNDNELNFDKLEFKEKLYSKAKLVLSNFSQ
jgi:hypothetical protein